MDMAPGVREILHYSLLKPNGITYPLPEFLIGGTFCFVKQYVNAILPQISNFPDWTPS